MMYFEGFTEELMLLNCGAGENSWESLGQQGDQNSESQKKLIINLHWKDWCWSWNSNTLANCCEELTHWKRPWCWERLKAGGEGDDRGQMVGWHHWLNGHEFEQALGYGDGQGSLAYAAVHGVTKNWTRLSDWTIATMWKQVFLV